MGEGGLALVPCEHAEAVYGLVNYGEAGHRSASWLQNAKISDISCAFLIDRLERSETWLPLYAQQRKRILDIIGSLGLRPLCPAESGLPMTSMPFVSDRPIPEKALQGARFLTFAKYYKPLAPLPRVMDLYDRLANIPCHPDLARLSDAEIRSDVEHIAGIAGGAGTRKPVPAR